MSVDGEHHHQDHSALRRIHATMAWHGGFASTQRVRHHAFTVDEPLKLGGTDAGPTPLEYALGAYDACLQIVIAMVAREMGIAVHDIAIESVATVDRRGLFGTAPVSPHFRCIETEIALAWEGTDADVDLLRTRVQKRCPMLNLVQDAGVEQQVHWSTHRSTAAS